MKKILNFLFISSLLFVATTYDSVAEIIASGDDCAANDGISTCHWEVDSKGNLIITGSGRMKSYSILANGDPNAVSAFSNNTPWEYLNVRSAYISGVSNIGEGAFFQLPELSHVEIDETVTSINAHAFNGYNTETSAHIDTLLIPDSLSGFGGYAIANARISNIMMSDVANTRILSQLARENVLSVKIICVGNLATCQQKLARYPVAEIVSATETQCNASSKYYYTGSSCERRPTDASFITCVNGYAKLKDNCVDPLKTFAKKHYTPAEAAQWLNEDNNTITITFKKQ